MKLYFVIKLLLLNCAYSKLTLSHLDEIEKLSIKSGDYDVSINQEGLLNMLHGYICDKDGLLHNKRFYSPEIRTIDRQKTQENSCIIPMSNPYIFKRLAAFDEIYKEEASTITNTADDTKQKSLKKNAELALISEEQRAERIRISQEYHAQLIKMFPSVHGNLSIEGDLSDSFTRFLRADSVKEHAYHLLAALLLLSEGLNVPIDIISSNNPLENNIILKRRKQNSPFFCLSTIIRLYIKETKQIEEVSQYSAIEIVKFFISQKKKTSFSTIKSIKDFNTGDFLENPQLLIHLYIFHFLDSVESTKKFILAVNEILTDIIVSPYTLETSKTSETENKSKFWNFFVSTDSATNPTSFLDDVKKIDAIVKEEKVFPFYEMNDLPSSTFVPRYKRKSQKNSKLQEKCFNNNVEISLYTVFCCLFYQPTTKRYDLGKVDKESEVGKFFTEYNEPLENISLEVQTKWSNLVSDLKCKDVSYKIQRSKPAFRLFNLTRYLSIWHKTNRNKLHSGMINILYVISQITNIDKESRDLICRLKQNVQAIEGDGRKVFFRNVQSSIKAIFESLSTYANLEVTCKDLYISTRSDGIQDLFGSITLHYTINRKKCGIQIEICEELVSVRVLENTISFKTHSKEGLTKIKNNYKTASTFIGCLIANHIEKFTRNSSISVDTVKNMLENDLQGINKIFLLQKIESTEYKKTLITGANKYAIEKKIEPINTSEIFRFVKNIFASLPLDYEDTIKSIEEYTQSYYDGIENKTKTYSKLLKQQINH